ncbi:conserved hypothetical protein [Neospora caninum Liverpool]|uniref:Uncharacterized protein n=1 Tax=Neospora caninum (strain Liverpool) TaxID=572307 RepID=F0VH25_NEOCL|nr:conserved hypothetical protein [Neospora caninum Liverpool]CBZ53019.1 conserved hypothetical protein [Neospora caninum Liverpool]|eukprot:XP_003883051.1 conserved hypothetical protein [Neospora caninum Liverpool]
MPASAVPSPTAPQANSGMPPSPCRSGPPGCRDLAPPFAAGDGCTDSSGASQNEAGEAKDPVLRANQRPCRAVSSTRKRAGTPARRTSSFSGDNEHDCLSASPHSLNANTPSVKSCGRQVEMQNASSLEAEAAFSSGDPGNEGHKPLETLSSSTSFSFPPSSPLLPSSAESSGTGSWPSAGKAALLLDEDEDIVMLKGEDSSWTKEKRDELMARVSQAGLRKLRDLFLDPYRKVTRPWTSEEIELLQADYRQNHEDWVEVLQPWQATPLHLQAVPFTYSVLKKAPLKFPAIFCKQIPFFFPHPSGIGVFHAVLIIERRPTEKKSLSRGGRTAPLTERGGVESASAAQKSLASLDESKERNESGEEAAGNACSPESCQISRRRRRRSAGGPSSCVSPAASTRKTPMPVTASEWPQDRNPESSESKTRSSPARLSRGRAETDTLCSQSSGEHLTEDVARLALIWEPYQETGAALPTVSEGSKDSGASAASSNESTVSPPSSPCSPSSPIPALELPDDGLQPGAFAHVVTGRLSLPFSSLQCPRGRASSASESASSSLSAAGVAVDHCASPFAFTSVQSADTDGLAPSLTPGQLQRQENKKFLRMQRLQQKLLQGLEEADVPELVFEGRVVGCELHGFLPFDDRETEARAGRRPEEGDGQRGAEAGTTSPSRVNGSDVEAKYGKLCEAEQEDKPARGQAETTEASLHPLARAQKTSRTREGEAQERENLAAQRPNGLNREETQNVLGRTEKKSSKREGESEDRTAGTWTGDAAAVLPSERKTSALGKNKRLGLRQRMLLCVRLDDDRIFLYEIRSFINHSAKTLVDWERRVRVAEREIAAAAGPLAAPSSVSPGKASVGSLSPSRRSYLKSPSLPASPATAALMASGKSEAHREDGQTEMKASEAVRGAGESLAVASSRDSEEERQRRRRAASSSRAQTSEQQESGAAKENFREQGETRASPSAPASPASLRQGEDKEMPRAVNASLEKDELRVATDSSRPAVTVFGSHPVDGLSREAVSSPHATPHSGPLSEAGASAVSASTAATLGGSLPSVPTSVPPSPASPHSFSRPEDSAVPAADEHKDVDVSKDELPPSGLDSGETDSIPANERKAICAEQAADFGRSPPGGEREEAKFGSEPQIAISPVHRDQQNPVSSPQTSSKTTCAAACSSSSASTSSSLSPSAAGCDSFSRAGAAIESRKAESVRRRALAAASPVGWSPAERTGARRGEEKKTGREIRVAAFNQTSPVKRRLPVEEEEDVHLWLDCDDTPAARRSPTSPCRYGGPRGGACRFGKAFSLAPLAVFHDLQWDAADVTRLGDADYRPQNVFSSSACERSRGKQDVGPRQATPLRLDRNGALSSSGGPEKENADSGNERETGAVRVCQDGQNEVFRSAALCFFFSVYEEVEENDGGALAAESTHVNAILPGARAVQGAEEPETVHAASHLAAKNDDLSSTARVSTNVKAEVPDAARLEGKEQTNTLPTGDAHTHKDAAAVTNEETGDKAVGECAAGALATAERGSEAARSGVSLGKTGGQRTGWKRRKIAVLSHLAAVARAPQGFPHGVGASGWTDRDTAALSAGGPGTVPQSPGGVQPANVYRETSESESANFSVETCLHNACSSIKSEASSPARSGARHPSVLPDRLESDSPRTGVQSRVSASSSSPLGPWNACYFPPNCIPMDISATPGKTSVVFRTRRWRTNVGCADGLPEKGNVQAETAESLVARHEKLPTMVTVDTSGCLRAWSLGDPAACFAAQKILTGPLLAVSVNQQLPALAAIGAGDGRVRICDVSAFLAPNQSHAAVEGQLQPLASPLITLPSPLGEDLYRVFGRQHPVRRLQWLAGGALLGVVHEQPESERHVAAFGSCAALWAPGKDVFDEVNDAAQHKLFWARAAKHPQAAKFARLVCVHVAHAVAALDRSEGANGAPAFSRRDGSARMLGCDFLFSRKGGISGVSTDTASMLHFWKPGSWLLGDVEDVGVLARKTADKEQLSRALRHVATQIQLRSHVATRAEKAKMQRQAETAGEDVERAAHGESLACTREALMRPWQKFLAVRPVTRALMENLRAEIQEETAAFDLFAEPHIHWLETK